MTLLLTTAADRGGLPEWLLYYQRLSMGLEVEVASFCSWILSNWSCNGTKFLNAALEIAVSIAVFRLPHGTLLTLRGFGIQLRLDSVACWGWENGLQVPTLSEQGG